MVDRLYNKHNYMKYISSPQNTILKDLKALKTSARTRKDQSKTILEGMYLVKNYLKAGFKPEFCIISESSVENDEVQAILDVCDERSIRYVSVSDGQFKLISSVENGLGLAAVIEIPTENKEPTLKRKALLIDGIQDPGNLGAMLRIAAAAGVDEVYCSSTSTSPWSPKALRAGMGAQHILTTYENIDLASVIADATIPVYAVTANTTTTVYDEDLTRSCAWLIGSESQGVSKELLNLQIKKISIPQVVGTESLNVAAATAICLFEQCRQQRQ